MKEIKRPNQGSWKKIENPTIYPDNECEAYANSFGVLVVSGIHVTEERKQEWAVSISEFGRYPSQGTINWVRQSFGIEDFELDNHSAKRIACLWKPFVKDLEGECPCKE